MSGIVSSACATPFFAKSFHSAAQVVYIFARLSGRLFYNLTDFWLAILIFLLVGEVKVDVKCEADIFLLLLRGQFTLWTLNFSI